MARAPLIASRTVAIAYRVRQRLGPEFEGALASFLERQGRRVAGALPRKVAGSDVFDTESERQALTDELGKWYTRVLQLTYPAYQEILGVSFELDDPITRQFLRECGENITKINANTRDAIRQALVDGQELGESYSGLAKRIREATAFNRQRAITIARTEMGQSTNRAAILNFDNSGVVKGVLVFDSEKDTACAEWAGKRIPLSEIGSVPLLGHPRCIRAFGALVDM